MRSTQCPICKKTFETNHGRQVYCHDCLSFPKSGNAAVYALCNVGETAVSYIGSTTNPVKRYMDHRQNGSVEMFILEVIPVRDAKTSEERQMRHYSRVGELRNKRAAASKTMTQEEKQAYLAAWFANQ